MSQDGQGGFARATGRYSLEPHIIRGPISPCEEEAIEERMIARLAPALTGYFPYEWRRESSWEEAFPKDAG